MTAPSATHDTPLEARLLYVTNMLTSVLGGLSLVLAVTAPLTIGMATWSSFADVVLTAVLCGDLPLACASSVMLSRWLFTRGQGPVAVIVATAPLFLLAGSLTWSLVGG